MALGAAMARRRSAGHTEPDAEPGEDLVEIRSKIDWSAPTGTTEDGKRFWTVRCRSPFRFTVDAGATVTPRVAPTARAEGEEGESDEGTPSTMECVASSTSVDSYGTEMSKACLDAQRAQLASSTGVSLLPTHGSWFKTPEWDDEIGRSIDAKVEKGSVENGYDGKTGHLLRATFRMYDDVEDAQKLLKRVARKQPIGLSIGGWFTEIRIISNDDGEVERMIVEDVDLDHVAVTRRPSNPDCVGMSAMRSALGAAVTRSRAEIAARTPVVPVSDPAPTTPDPDPIVTVPVTSALDDAPPAGDATEQDPADVRSGASPVDSPPAGADPPETNMPTEAETQFLAALTLLTAQVAALEARTAPAAAPPAPAPAAPTLAPAPADEVVALRAKIAQLDETLQRVLSQPQRRGVQVTRGQMISAGPEGITMIDDLVTRAKAEGSPALAAAVGYFKLRIVDESRNACKAERADLENALTAVCIAAEADGLITDPRTTTSWTAWS